jgi:hypothetical protein
MVARNMITLLSALLYAQTVRHDHEKFTVENTEIIVRMSSPSCLLPLLPPSLLYVPSFLPPLLSLLTNLLPSFM